MRSPKLILSTAVVVFSLAGAATLAWACTPGSALDPILPAGGSSRGAGMSLSGRNFQAGPVPVEIRWDSIDGPVIGTAQGPDFSTAAKIPTNATLGVHYVVAIQRDVSGLVVAKMTETYEVVKGGSPSGTGNQASMPAARQVPSDLWSGFQKGGSGLLDQPAVTVAETGQKSMIAGLAAASVALSLFTALSVAAIRRRRLSNAGK